MTKATEARARNALERQRAKLKQRELELTAAERTLKREREELRRERGNTIALLQVLTEQYGNPAWDADTPIPDVIEKHLMDPIMARVSRLLRTTPSRRTPAATAPPAPTPTRPPAAPPAPIPQPTLLRPTPLPDVPHRSLVVRAQDRDSGQMGFTPRCMRGCRITAVWPTEREALQAAHDHDIAANAAEGRPVQGRSQVAR